MANGEDSWSSSDGGNSEQEGEYTGKFRVVHVPTKVDPPTSGTRGRIESWGRPISPFPRRGSPIPEIELDDAVDDAGDLDLSLVQPQFHVEEVGDRHVPEPPMDVREPASKIEVPQEPATATEISETEEISTSQELTHDNRVEITLGGEEAHESSGGPPIFSQEDVREEIETGDESVFQDGNTPVQEQDEAVNQYHPGADSLISAEVFDFHPDNDERGLIGEEQDEETVVRALSEELASPPPEPQLLEERIEVDEPMVEPVDGDAESEEDSSDESDLSVVKIVSDDPWAAARAAAILKQVCLDSHVRVLPF